MSEIDDKYNKLYALLTIFEEEVNFRISKHNLREDFTSCWADNVSKEQEAELESLLNPYHAPRDGIRASQDRAEKLLKISEIKLDALKKGNLIQELAALKCYSDKETLKQLTPKELAEDPQMLELIKEQLNLANACGRNPAPSTLNKSLNLS